MMHNSRPHLKWWQFLKRWQQWREQRLHEQFRNWLWLYAQASTWQPSQQQAELQQRQPPKETHTDPIILVSPQPGKTFEVYAKHINHYVEADTQRMLRVKLPPIKES